MERELCVLFGVNMGKRYDDVSSQGDGGLLTA